MELSSDQSDLSIQPHCNYENITYIKHFLHIFYTPFAKTCQLIRFITYTLYSCSIYTHLPTYIFPPFLFAAVKSLQTHLNKFCVFLFFLQKNMLIVHCRFLVSYIPPEPAGLRETLQLILLCRISQRFWKSLSCWTRCESSALYLVYSYTSVEVAFRANIRFALDFTLHAKKERQKTAHRWQKLQTHSYTRCSR